MERKAIKRQQAETLFRDTFSILIQQLGEDCIYIAGKKMYIRQPGLVVSVEFTGATLAYGNVTLSAITKYGMIDVSVMPLFTIFKECKAGELDKQVAHRVVLNATGEYTFVWSYEMTEEDKIAINQAVLTYVEAFLNL